MFEFEPLVEKPQSQLESLQVLHIFTIEIEMTKIIAL